MQVEIMHLHQKMEQVPQMVLEQLKSESVIAEEPPPLERSLIGSGRARLRWSTDSLMKFSCHCPAAACKLRKRRTRREQRVTI